MYNHILVLYTHRYDSIYTAKGINMYAYKQYVGSIDTYTVYAIKRV